MSTAIYVNGLERNGTFMQFFLSSSGLRFIGSIGTLKDIVLKWINATSTVEQKKAFKVIKCIVKILVQKSV